MATKMLNRILAKLAKKADAHEKVHLQPVSSEELRRLSQERNVVRC